MIKSYTTKEIVKYASLNTTIESEQKKRLNGKECWVCVDDLKKEIEHIRRSLAQHQFKCDNPNEDWLIGAYETCNQLLEIGRADEQDLGETQIQRAERVSKELLSKGRADEQLSFRRQWNQSHLNLGMNSETPVSSVPNAKQDAYATRKGSPEDRTQEM